jgi:hypothetical protein
MRPARTWPALLVATLVVFLIGWWLVPRPGAFPHASESAIVAFAAKATPTRPDYLGLTGYFVEGFLTYASAEFATADYPGYRSSHGALSDRIEGFSRMAPLMAAWLNAESASSMRLPSGRVVDIAGLLSSALTAGTDPASPEYWGELQDLDHRIVEASDVALALWLSRHQVWDRLPRPTRERITAWLNRVNRVEAFDNNWQLFGAIVNAVLKALGEPYDDGELRRHVLRVKSFYRGDGWFTDGPNGPFDYYNAWGFHYHLSWLHRIDPSLEPDFIPSALTEFGKRLVYLITPYGFPIMGRSICYRVGVSAPVIFAARMAPGVVSPRLARRALDATWTFFLGHGAARNGRITQGYCGDDPRILDGYSGPASCLWSLRSLVAAYTFPADSEFWTAPPEPLPVEVGDYELVWNTPGFRVTGTQATANVRLTRLAPPPNPEPVVRPYTLFARAEELLRGGIRRPGNGEAKYRRAYYDARPPFCACRN